jgi:hypothetical protein
MEKLTEAIRQGVRNAYFENQALKTSYKSFDSSIVEYLITVNIAQSLFKWNAELGYIHSIALEFDVGDFVKNCFPQRVEIIDLWSTIITTPESSTIQHNDSGRLDIAIFKNQNESYFPIEVKAINLNYDLIVEDVERIAKVITKKDLNGINNTACCGFCVFLKYIGGDKRVSHPAGLASCKNRIISEFKNRVKHLETQHSCKISADPFEICKKTNIDIVDNPLIKEYGEAAEETGSIFGVLVKIERN